MKKRVSAKNRIILLLTIFILTACGNNSTAESMDKETLKTGEKPVLNLYTEILNFPDPAASEITEKDDNDSFHSGEPEIFAKNYNRIYRKRVADAGGRPPLKGPEKTEFDRESMLIQAGLLFDMRLGKDHPKRDEFIDVVKWCFNQRQPIDQNRQQLINKGPEYFDRAEKEFMNDTAELQKKVESKLKKILNSEDYAALTAHR